MVYGSGDDFKQYMATLKAEGKESTRVYVLNPDYIKKNVGKDNVLCRASALFSFNDNSNFSAGSGYINFNFRRVRGVRLVVAEGDVAQKIEDPVSNAYDLILDPNNKQNALSLMTPERVAGLSGLVTEYLALQTQK
jgi:hypothetical protein